MNARVATDLSAVNEVRVLVFARSAPLRRRLVHALGMLPDVCILGAYSTEEAVIDRARRDAVDVLLVESEIDPIGFAKSCAVLPHPPAWFTVADGPTDPSTTTRAILGGAAGVLPCPKDQEPAELAAVLRAQVRSRSGAEPRDQRPRARTSSVPRARTTPPPPLPALAIAPPASLALLPTPVVGRFRRPELLRREILGIGCSTGGPPAVTALVRGLPLTFRPPIAIVQHMAAAHIPYFVDGLRRQLERPVHLAEQGAPLEPGQVYVAAGDHHLGVAREGSALRLRLIDGPPEHNCRPAVDPFFRSLAATCGATAIGVVLTGMGSDGALGGRAMHDAGAPVLVQDSQTSIVWGMPGATYQAGAASAVLPLEQLAGEILQWSL